MKKIKSLSMAITMIAIFLFVGCRPKTVTNPATGKTWMDRNLGASQVATSSTDEAAYGNLYQWGRATEGHESRKSGTTNSKATTAVPGGGNPWDALFITEPERLNDWLSPHDNTLWQGVSGTNNPCPSGFRLPTDEEWEAERLSWVTNDKAGAFGSPLKLTVGGWRNHDEGMVVGDGWFGYYWSSSHPDGPTAHLLHFDAARSHIRSVGRVNGFSVRCIKD